MTPKQRRFVDEYLIDFNATQAAIRTGYAAGSAEVTGSRLLRNAKVQTAISAAQQQQTEKLGITVEGVLRAIARLASSDVRKLFDEAGNLRSIHDLSDEIAAAVASVEVVIRPMPGGKRGEFEHIHKVRFWDKNVALTNLARYVLDRKARLTPFKLSPLESPTDMPKAMAAIVAAVAAGELTSAEASGLSRLVETYVKALEAVDFDQRIRALEENAKRDETT